MDKLNNMEVHQLERIMEVVDDLNRLVEDNRTAKWLSDGEPMLINFMYINFWLAQVKADSGRYSLVIGNARKYAEAKRRLHKPSHIVPFWSRFKACWVASREWQL